LAKSPAISCGLLLYRRSSGGLEVLLAHPGGPFWAKKDTGAWSLPKGEPDQGENELKAACREFEEETGIKPEGPFLPLGTVRQKGGKTIHAWAWEGDADPSVMCCNEIEIEWPPRSGKRITIPEVDRCEWVDPATARRKLNAAQVLFIDRLEEALR
jgi:predicted NUDIX family NTP pyrophosphohydrolase